MPVITFRDEKQRTRAALTIRNQFGQKVVILTRKWMRLKVTEEMLRVLEEQNIPYEAIPGRKIKEEEKELKTGSRLYDLRERTYPSERGDVFRSRQVFRCWVCGAKINRIVMGGSPGYGVLVICLNSAECWHHELEDKLKLLEQPHSASYRRELKKEITASRKSHKRKAKNDLAGSPDLPAIPVVMNVRAYEKGGCKHSLF